MKRRELTMCSNTSCGKYQCARHRNRHADSAAGDLNPEGRTICPRYLSMYAAPKAETPTVEIPTTGRKGGAI